MIIYLLDQDYYLSFLIINRSIINISI